jgi:hypothetical protein
MTPAERARQIDKEEFAAECAAIRQRAYTFAQQRERETRHRIETWLGREAPVSKFNGTSRRGLIYRPPVKHEAFGKSQSLKQWAAEYGIGIGTVRTRLKLGWTLEDALTREVIRLRDYSKKREPGGGLRLPRLQGNRRGVTPAR